MSCEPILEVEPLWSTCNPLLAIEDEFLKATDDDDTDSSEGYVNSYDEYIGCSNDSVEDYDDYTSYSKGYVIGKEIRHTSCYPS